jgi:hypothetical protein
MNTTIQNLLESLVTVDAPTIPSPFSATKLKNRVPQSSEESVSECLSSEDMQIVDWAADEEPPAIPGRDERRSCRFVVPHTQQACEMKVGTQTLLGALVDMSEGGFAVLVARLDGLKVGRKVELNTDMGRFTVRITYINEVARPKKAASGSDFWFRLGMKKTRRFFLF